MRQAGVGSDETDRLTPGRVEELGGESSVVIGLFGLNKESL